MRWTWQSLWTKESELSCLGVGKVVCSHCRLFLLLHGEALTTLLFAVQGTLKGYDQLLNLVMDETIEYLRGKLTWHTWL